MIFNSFKAFRIEYNMRILCFWFARKFLFVIYLNLFFIEFYCQFQSWTSLFLYSINSNATKQYCILTFDADFSNVLAKILTNRFTLFSQPTHIIYLYIFVGQIIMALFREISTKSPLISFQNQTKWPKLEAFSLQN